MEESSGYVGVVTTYDADGMPTGGLMQASGCHGYDGQSNLTQVSPRLDAHAHTYTRTCIHTEPSRSPHENLCANHT